MYKKIKNVTTTLIHRFVNDKNRLRSISNIFLISCFSLCLLIFPNYTNATTKQECEVIAFEMISRGTHIESSDIAEYRQLLESECSQTIKESVVITLSDPTSASKPLKSYISKLNKSGNMGAYSNNTFEKSSSSAADISPPELVSMHIASQSVDVTSGEKTIEVAISLRDESGIAQARFWFRQSEYNLSKYPVNSSTPWVYNNQTQTYDATFIFVFDETAVEGDWGLSSVLSIADTIGNRTSSYDSALELGALGLIPFLTVINSDNAVLFDSKVDPIVDYSRITTNQESEFKLYVEGSEEYELTVFANDSTSLSKIDFFDATSTASSCRTVSNKINCTFSAIPVSDYITAKISSSAANASNFGLVVFLNPTGDSLESDWSSNSVNYPQTDIDGDGIANIDDSDADGDDVDNVSDTFPFDSTESIDTDLDGIGNNADNDDDGDGYLDTDEVAAETDPLNSESLPLDTDGDFISNVSDTDDDADGILDEFDAFPLDATENADNDFDGLGNNADSDDDNDGIPDTYELANELDPLDSSDAALDKDSDGLANLAEFALGTDINNTDTDDDGITDNIDNNPLVFDEVQETLYSGQLYVLPDITADGVKELGILSVDTELFQVSLEVLDGSNQVLVRTVVWSDIYNDSSISLHVIDDMNDNDISEVGLFGVRDSANNEGKPQIFVRDLSTGIRVNVFNWPANWKQTKAIVLTDMTDDGIAEIGLQGRFKDGQRPQLVVKNGANAATLETFGYPNLFIDPQFYQHSDMDNDGVAEISTFGRIARNNKIQIKIASGIDSKDRLKAYNFPDKWDDVSWVKLDNSNDDAIDDWGLFGTNKQDGRPQLIVKDGTDPRGALRIHAWPAQILSAQFFAIPDINGDGVDEVAAAGLRTNGRHQFQVQDGVDRNSVLANYNLNLNLESVSYHVLPDLTGDGLAEIGFLGNNSAGEYQLVVREGDAANGEFRTDNLGSDWSDTPSIISLGDTNNDGLLDLLICGQNTAGDQLKVIQL